MTVYILKNTKNNTVYIGCSCNIKRRFIEHKSKLKKGYHPCRKLQKIADKYGVDCFYIEPIEKCTKINSYIIEQKHMDIYKPFIANNSKYAAPGKHRIGKPLHPNLLKAITGRKFKKASIEKMRKNSGNNKPIKCIETGEVFYNASEAARKHGGRHCYYTRVCSGERKHYKNLHYKFV